MCIRDSNLEGHQLQAHLHYTDGQGFTESITTGSIAIPYLDDGDAAFLIAGTPAVGNTLSISRSTDDPDGNGDADSPAITWQASTDAITWTTAGSGASFSIPHNLEGHQLQAHLHYTDGQGFTESITTGSIAIPYIDDGDATFLIAGTPAIGNTLSCLLYTSPSPRDKRQSRMPSSA